MEEKITVVVCLVGQEPEIREICPKSDDLERLLGGTADAHRVFDAVDLWLNEDALDRGMPPNRRVPELGFVHGPFVLAMASEEGDLLSFTPQRAAEVVAVVESWPTLPSSYPGRGRGPS